MLENRIETHAHTNIVSPCSRLAPRTLAKRYHRAGYKGIIVTDHLSSSLPIFRHVDTWREKVHRFYSGFRRVREAANSFDLVVYPGFELTFQNLPGRDYLVYGIDEVLLAEIPDVYLLDPIVFKEFATEIGAIIFRAHPFRNVNPSISLEFIDGLEIYNGNPRHDPRNELAAAYAARHGLSVSSGSDTHYLEDIGRGGISVPELPTTVRELVKLWRESPGQIELINGPQRVESG